MPLFCHVLRESVWYISSLIKCCNYCRKCDVNSVKVHSAIYWWVRMNHVYLGKLQIFEPHTIEGPIETLIKPWDVRCLNNYKYSWLFDTQYTIISCPLLLLLLLLPQINSVEQERVMCLQGDDMHWRSLSACSSPLSTPAGEYGSSSSTFEAEVETWMIMEYCDKGTLQVCTAWSVYTDTVNRGCHELIWALW